MREKFGTPETRFDKQNWISVYYEVKQLSILKYIEMLSFMRSSKLCYNYSQNLLTRKWNKYETDSLPNIYI